MKNENIGNSDLEKVLRDKMNELSDSVDCFDKISARAFPEKDPNFSESGYTVSDLENVTGRPRHGRILRWVALAAAVVLCIVFVPKTGIVRHILSNFGGGVKHNFTQIVAEIEAETELHQYQQLDVELDYYLKNDVLVTPLFSCPFEDSGKEDAMVRVFIRETGAGQFMDYDTAQVYAVEYTGEYSEANIIAAARSAYTFTDEELENVQKDRDTYNDAENYVNYAIAYSFTVDSDCFRSTDGEAISIACMPYLCDSIYGSDTVRARVSVLYGHNGLDSSDDYFYDIITNYGGEELELPDREHMWARSVYFNGSSAFPKNKAASNFRRTELFTHDSKEYFAENSFSSLPPFNQMYGSGGDDKYTPGKELSFKKRYLDENICTIAAPADPNRMLGLMVYYPYKGLENSSIAFYYDGKQQFEFSPSAFAYMRVLSAAEQDYLETKKSELEAQNAEELRKIAELQQEIEKNNIMTELEAKISSYEDEKQQKVESFNAGTDKYTQAKLQTEIDALQALIDELSVELEKLKNNG